MTSVMGSTIQRRRIIIQGIVQGVGFRPFVYGQALRWRLAGFVLNDSHGVAIEVEGVPEALEAFQHALRTEVPPLARIDSLVVESVPPRYETPLLLRTVMPGPSARRLSRPT
jgi:hydrogenase maturation protein HypF